MLWLRTVLFTILVPGVELVLVPLVEIAPRFVYPVLHKEIEELLDSTDDISWINRWNPNGAHHETLIINS